MKLTLSKPFKSIINPIDLDLPNFTVITGINGSGKSHLLQGIANKNIIASKEGKSITNVKLFNPGTLSLQQSEIATDQSANSFVKKCIKELHEARNGKNINIHNLNWPTSEANAIDFILKTTKKKFQELDESDIITGYWLYEKKSNQNIFTADLNKEFKRYYDIKLENDTKELLKKYKGYNIDYVVEYEFKRMYGEKPWELLNNILSDSKFPFRFTAPRYADTSMPFSTKLINETGQEISISDLSSGEKTIISLSIALFNIYKDGNLPELILIDEGDAHLHPSMCKQFVQVLTSVLVDRFKSKVILVTHNPSTIAFVEEESTYIMQKEEPRLLKATKDRALTALTIGVPSFSFLYENRKQVFVESHYDVKLHDMIYRKLRHKINQDISLSFIAAGKSEHSNCDEVIDIVKKLRDNGNAFIYGLIDWDGKNKDHDGIFVFSQDKYSIEQYIFDPLVMTAYFLKMKYVTKEVNPISNTNYQDILKSDTSLLQDVVNNILSSIERHLSTKVRAKGISDGGISVKVKSHELAYKEWFFKTRGHDIAEAAISAFPFLNKEARSEGYLNYNSAAWQIADHIYSDIPDLISDDFVKAFEKIQYYSKITIGVAPAAASI